MYLKLLLNLKTLKKSRLTLVNMSECIETIKRYAGRTYLELKLAHFLPNFGSNLRINLNLSTTTFVYVMFTIRNSLKAGFPVV